MLDSIGASVSERSLSFPLLVSLAAALAASMNLRASKKTSLAAARVALQAIRDSADAFPPLKSTATGIIIVWEAIEVSILSPLFHVT